MPAPSPLLKRTTAPSRGPNSPWRGAPMPGRCWRCSASTIRDRSRLRRRAARALLRAAAVDGVVALPRHLAADRRDPVVLYQDLRHCPRPGARREQRQPVAPRQASSRPSARSGRAHRPYRALGTAIIARSWPSWSAVRPGHGGRVRRGAGRTGQDLSSPAAAMSALPSRTAHAGPETSASEGAMSISPFPGRPIAGSKARLRAGVSCSRLVPPGPQQPNSGGRHSRDKARRSGSNGAATPRRHPQSALPILSAPKENSRLIPKRWSACAPPSTPAASDSPQPDLEAPRPYPDRCWFAGKDWALSGDETP